MAGTSPAENSSSALQLLSGISDEVTELEELAAAQREALERDRAVLKEMQVQAHTYVIWELRKCTFHSGGELEAEVVYLLLLGYNFATLVGVRTKICWTMPNIHAIEMFSI